jgi:DNA repair exonuclease SbcCD nuclease subunit
VAKVALISDLHWGVRNDVKSLLNNQEKFFNEVFFPYVDHHEIRHVINLGDTVDRRKYINFNTARSLTQTLMEPLYAREIESHFILGNHDVSFKDSNELNALEELYGGSKYLEHMRVYQDPAEINIDGLDILLLPWITTSNRDVSFRSLQESKATVLMGHLELAGFEMYRGAINEHGMDRDLFKNFDVVCSGHFHHKSTVGSINYLGSTGQYTWSDYGDARGFHVLDTSTRELEFVANPFYMFNKFYYDDSKKTAEQMMSFDAEKYRGTYVKVIVKCKNDPYLLERVVDKFEKHDIVNLQVIEDRGQLLIEEGEEDLPDEAEDTLTIIKKYVSSMNVEDPKRLEKFMAELYEEASSVQ